MSHDINGPSRLQRREACPGSARLESQIPEAPASPASERGRDLHARVARVLQGDDDMAGVTGGLSLDDAAAVVACIEFANVMRSWDANAVSLIEHPVDLSAYGIEEGGTIDFAVVVPGGACWTVDWKFGQGWVPRPRVNRQSHAYLLGIANDYGCTTGTASIFQPAGDSAEKTDTFTSEDFAVLGGDIRHIVAKAKVPDAPLAVGEHCQYCAAITSCPARAAQAQAMLAPTPMSPADRFLALSPEDRRHAYDRLKLGLAWAEGALSAIDQAILAGTLTVPGLTIGAGRSSRSWTNVAAAERVLVQHLGEKAHTRALLSVAQAEKALKQAGIPSSKMVDESGGPLVAVSTGAPRVVRDGSGGLVGDP